MTTRFIRTLSTGARFSQIQKVMILGGGSMGSGIAQVAAVKGNDVTIVDMDGKILSKSKATIEKSLKRIATKKFKEPEKVDKFLSESLGRIKTDTDATKVVKDVDLVVEAIVENLEIKQAVYKKLDEEAPEKTIFASNTSSLSITALASSTKREDRFGGLHFFNPVPMMKLVEVIKTSATSQETFDTLFSWSESLGKTAVTCKDTPGFLVNRLLVPYMAEAVRLHERGHGSLRDIDTAMKLGCGYPMGPIELTDYVGLDISKAVLEVYKKAMPDNPLFNNSELLDKLVAEGKLGIKSGEGFYKYGSK